MSGWAAYGMAYLGCTLPVFIGVVGASLQLHGIAAATGQFMLFGAGMGAVLTVLTIGTALFGDGVIRRIRHLRMIAAHRSARPPDRRQPPPAREPGVEPSKPSTRVSRSTV